MKGIRYGYFKHRMNRFVVEHSLDEISGEIIQSYIPNPGRLWELFFPDVKLILVKNKPSAKYRYSIEGVYKGDQLVSLNTIKNNDLAEYWLQRGLAPRFRGYEIFKREVRSPIGKSRFDFLLQRQGEPLYLEVKSCSLFQGEMAMFPDAPTQRGARHLEELLELHQRGYHCGVLIIVQSMGSRYFLPEYHTDPHFASLFLKCRNKLDLEVLGTQMNDDLRFHADPVELSIPWDILERENRNRGILLQIHTIGKNSVTETGKKIPQGYYLGITYHADGLEKEENRAQRRKKKPRTLAEELRAAADKSKIFSIRGKRPNLKTFCQGLPGSLREESPGEGASFKWYYAESDPLDSREFIQLLLYYRMEKILE